MTTNTTGIYLLDLLNVSSARVLDNLVIAFLPSTQHFAARFSPSNPSLAVALAYKNMFVIGVDLLAGKLQELSRHLLTRLAYP